MGNVSADHQQVVVAYARDAATVLSSNVDGDRFADGVVITNDQRGLFAAVFQILRFGPDGGVGPDRIAHAQTGPSYHRSMSNQMGPGSYGDVRTHIAEWANLCVVGNLGAGFNYSRGMYVAHWFLLGQGFLTSYPAILTILFRAYSVYHQQA